MEKGSQVNRHTEKFLRYAAANCGIPATHRGSHEAVDTNSRITLFIYDKPQNIPERRLRTVEIQVNAVRAGQLAINQACEDRPFEGTVTKSGHKEIKRGDDVIGLVSQGCEALLVNTANSEEMEHLMETFSDPRYRQLVTV